MTTATRFVIHCPDGWRSRPYRTRAEAEVRIGRLGDVCRESHVIVEVGDLASLRVIDGPEDNAAYCPLCACPKSGVATTPNPVADTCASLAMRQEPCTCHNREEHE